VGITTYNTTSLTGGSTRSLDVLLTSTLVDGDRAHSQVADEFFVHYFDATGAEAENSPSVIRPDDFIASGSAGVWKILKSPLELPALSNIGNAGISLDLDGATYDTFVFTCDQTALSVTISGLGIGYTMAAVITDGDNAAITWPAEVLWARGEEPAFSDGVDRVVFQRITAGIVHGSLAGQEYA
jgi:hypothetical protein